MKRAFCIFLLSLMVMGLFATPTGYEITPEIIDHFGETLPNETLYYPDLGFPTVNYFPSAEGDLSSDSITSFSETTADDVLFYPDLFTLDVTEAPDNGYADGNEVGTWANTQTKDATTWDISSDDAYLEVLARADVEGFAYSLYAKEHAVGNAIEFEVYDWVDSAYDTLTTVAGTSLGWHNGTTNNAGYVNSTNYLKFRFDIAVTEAVYIDYLEIDEWHILTMMDSDHYAESFADVSDWSVTSGNAPTTDNDVMSWVIPNDGNYDTIYTDVSASYENNYVEFRYKTNTVTAVIVLGIKLYSGDAGAGTCIKQNYFTAYTTWTTTKYIIPSDTVVESILFVAKSTTDALTIQCDYLRIGESDEMGWQHDCSTTEGVTDDGDADFTYTKEVLNDDTLNCSAITSASTNQWADIMFAYDTTTTVSDIERDYYQFVEFRWRCTSYVAGTNALYVSINTDGKRLSPAGGYRYATFGWVTERYNMLAFTTDSSAKYVDFIVMTDTAGEGAVFEIDYIKFYSIANFTVSRSGSPDWTTSDYLYVDNGDVVSVAPTVGWMRLDYDPTLSVATATHNVWNATLSSGASDFRFREYVDSTWTFFDQGETRGELSSGTLTDLSLYFYGACTLSAIKFWEDATAPDILDKFVTPPNPNDAEAVSFTAVTSDLMVVYKCVLNAVVYPTGFNDVDYEMTEQIAGTLWYHTFSTMTEGYYLFEVKADDGINTYSEYIPVTVGESVIVVEEITLIGAGTDFEMMTFSARINKDCTYIIYEESVNNAEAATHSGSVSEPSFNLAWTKLDTTDSNVNFTIKFTNGTLIYNYTSQYQVAQAVLSITSYDWSLSESQVAVSYQTAKAGTYTLYIDDVQTSTSSFVAGSNFLNWSRPSSIDPVTINAALKLTDGITTIWLNHTYDEFALEALSIQMFAFEVDEPNVSIFVHTNWLNCTISVYENEVLKVSGPEGSLSYEKSTAHGIFEVAVKACAVADCVWGNFSYTGVPDNLTITSLSFNTWGEHITAFATTNWLNCTLYLYEDDNGGWVLMSEEPEGETVRYLKATAAGNYAVKLRIEGGTDEKNIEFSYSVAANDTLRISTLVVDKSGCCVTAFVTTNWHNCTITLYEDNVQQDTGAEGVTLGYTKSVIAGTYSVALKIDGGAELSWYNTTYSVDVVSLLVTDDSIRTTESYAYLSGHVNLNANYTVYEETVQVGTGSVNAGSFEIRWTKASSSVENVTVLFESDAQSYPVYTGYDVAAQVTFVVESWWMDLNLGVESYVEFYVLTSFENATVYVYDNNTLMTTVTESAGGAYSYFWMSASEGLHTIVLNITHGGTVHTRTRTYYVPDWAATGLVVRWDLWTFQNNYTLVTLKSNWMNCTYYVYLNSSLVATSANDPVTLNFTREMNVGVYNLTIHAYGGNQNYTVSNIRYIVTEEGVSYDYSVVSGGHSYIVGDTYEGDTYGDTYENPEGAFFDQETVAIIAVGGFLIMFTAFLVAREIKQRDREKTERKYSQ